MFMKYFLWLYYFAGSVKLHTLLYNNLNTYTITSINDTSIISHPYIFPYSVPEPVTLPVPNLNPSKFYVYAIIRNHHLH